MIVCNFESFEDYIKEEYTSRSGFISHYSNDSNDWLQYLNIESLQDEPHYLGTFIDFVFGYIFESFEGEDIFNAFHEKMYKFCEITNFDELTENSKIQ